MRKALLLLFILLVSCAKEPNPPFYRIDAEKDSFIFGTIHLPQDMVMDMPEEIIEAIRSCDHVYNEIPLGLEAMMDAGSLQVLEGETLEDLLPEDLYRRAEIYINKKGFSIDTFNGFKIWVLATNLPMLDVYNELMNKPSVDVAVYNTAVEFSKDTGGLETPEEQLSAFDSLTVEEQIELLDETLDELENTGSEELIDELIKTYREGDVDRILRVSITESEEHGALDRKINKTLIIDRNFRMADKIESLVGKECFFFAVGAGHLGGDEGIIKLLNKRGIKVERENFIK